MSKGKSITLLTIVSVLMAAILVMSLIRFPIGVKNYNSALGAIGLDYDVEGGIAYTMTLAEDNEVPVDDVNDVIETVKGRLEALGYTIYTIKSVKSVDDEVLDYDIRIEVKNTDSVSDDIAAVAAYGEVKFYGGESQDPTTRILEDISVIKDSQYLWAMSDTDHYISFILTEEACDALIGLIGDASSYYLKVTCGEDAAGNEITLLNTSISKSTLEQGKGELTISGLSSEKAAKQKALQIKNGGLPHKYELSAGEVITSPFGADLGLKLTIAVVTLLVIILIGLFVLYRGLGLIASLSMILFILFETWLLIGVPGIVVNLGGIVGILGATVLCALGMTVLMQRIKDEYANSKKTAKAAINKGFKAALVPTINLHVVSGLMAILLFAFTKGVINCFAITFGIGVVVSLISTLVFTRMYTALILPLVNDKEKFLRFKRADSADIALEEAEV